MWGGFIKVDVGLACYGRCGMGAFTVDGSVKVETAIYRLDVGTFEF